MNVRVIPTNNFKKAAKKLLKKYRSLKEELSNLEKTLVTNPKTGTALGKDAYKIRIAVKSKGKGRRGGLRVITYVVLDTFIDKDSNKVFLLSIYDKSDTESISKEEIHRLIDLVNP